MKLNEDVKIHIGAVETDPIEVGYNAEKLDKLDNHFINLIERKKIQCASYLLSRNNKTFACKSMGKLTYKEDSEDFMPDSIRKIASITKIFTSIAIMQLMEDGKIHLHQPVSSILSEFNTSQHKDITIFHLLTHTSGIGPDPGYFQEAYQRNWWNFNDNESWIKQGLTGVSVCKSGESWNYSTLGFMMLGEIISRVSGSIYEEYVMENIITPLGLTNTFFNVPEELKHKVCVTDEWEEKWLYSAANLDRTGKPPRAGHGWFSTLGDLCKLGEMMLNKGSSHDKQIISRKALELMTMNHLNNVPGFSWGGNHKNYKMGLGIALSTINDTFVSHNTFNHEGAGACALYIDPTEQLVAAYFVPFSEWCAEAVVSPRNIIWSGII